MTRARPHHPSLSDTGGAAAPLLDVRGVTKRFGGVLANRNISFRVAPGELVGVIGPNGAGKSTLFDVLTGFQAPDAGEVWLDGERITGLRPDEISRRGVGRTFQKLKPFGQMTVVENVMVGAFQKTADPREAREGAMAALEAVGLADKADAYARVLSTGQRKRLEMARALATRPRLLLLDEVTGGVDQRSISGLVELVQRLNAQGMALVVIEHNMRVIMGISQRVVALHLGEVIADGPPQTVASDPHVIKAYLGQAYAN
jgi:branched-chain amino acid transport system ATP-binding protein